MIYRFSRVGPTTLLLSNGDRATFLPGQNELDDAAWAEASQYPGAIDLLESGELTVVNTPAPKAEAKPKAAKAEAKAE